MSERLGVLEALEREQRDALALWRSLTEPEWQRPSWCDGWTVKDVVIHTIRGESEVFLPYLRRALDGERLPPEGFDLARLNDEQIAEGRRRSVAELLDEAEETVTRSVKVLAELTDEQWAAPAWNPISPSTAGFYVKGRIWEWWTHGQDIRVPLRRPGGREPERTTPVVEVVRDGITGVFLPERAEGVKVSYAFQVGPTGWTVRIDDGTIAIDPTFDSKATSRVHADPATFVLVGTQRVSQMKAVLSRKFRPSGNPIAGMRFLSYFRAP